MSAPTQAQVTIAPAFSLQTLREVLAELKAQEPERGGRWDRAATIVALCRIEPTAAGAYWVQSESDPDREYWVCQPLPRIWTCTRKDFEQRGGPCKPALSVILLQACEAREGGMPPPAPIAVPQRVYSDADRFELTSLREAHLDGLQAPTPAA